MQWVVPSASHPQLPARCEPTSDFLLRFSSAFHVCVPTPLALVSNVLGTVSIAAWLFAQLPQIYKNWSISSTSGLSIWFLVEWCLGDLTNLLGALFTHQASWQVTIAAYYVFVDLCLVIQWIWYEKLKHGATWKSLRSDNGSYDQPRQDLLSYAAQQDLDRHSLDADGLNGQTPSPSSRPRIIFRAPTFDTLASEEHEKTSSPSSGPKSISSRSNMFQRKGDPSFLPSPSPRTVLFIACLVAIAQASPITDQSAMITVSHRHFEDPSPTALEFVGTVLSWTSTVLYLGSRLPQLIKNWRRKSTAGLSPHLFIAAFCGNLFYSAALATNPCAWSDFGPYGGGGWVGREGSDRVKWVAAALPFFLGAAGVLGLDASVGVQFLIYGERESEVKMAMMSEGPGHVRHWRRVSGWMRGWAPSKSPRSSIHEEQQVLINAQNDYGTL